MESPLIFNLGFINKKGQTIDQPNEWEPVALHIHIDPSDWDQYTLLINFKQQELFLKKINGEKKLVTDFIRLSAGHYKITFKYHNQVNYERFSIYPKKISNESFKTMLEDLVYGLPADIAVSLSELGAFTGVNLVQNQKVTIAQEVLRLKRTWFGTDEKLGLSKIIEVVSNRPYHVLKTNELWVKSEEVRRPNTSKIVQSLVRSQNITPSGRPIQVIDSRVEHSFNVYENQMLKLYTHQFQMKLLRLTKFFRITKNEKLIVECEELLKSFNFLMRKAAFLEQVELPVNFHFKTTMVLLNVPIYRAAMEGFLEFQRVITTNIDNAEVDSPLENTPKLYQKWGTLKVISVVLRSARTLGYQVKSQRLEAKVMGGKTIKLLPDGKPVLVLFHPISKTTVKVIPERSYTNKGNPLRSISFTQKPDISIEVSKPNEDIKVYLFDPKYKLDSEDSLESGEIHKPQKVDIDKMHSYRDAIRNEAGERVVQYAAILYPGETVLFHKGLNAIRSYPGDEEGEAFLEGMILKALNNSN